MAAVPGCAVFEGHARGACLAVNEFTDTDGDDDASYDNADGMMAMPVVVVMMVQ